MTWSDGAIPCQVSGHEHVAACDSSTGFQLPFCGPHFGALPVAVRKRIAAIAEASIWETESHAVAVELVERGRRWLAGRKVPGICFVCGCTDEFGCDEGCSWTDKGRTLCSACDRRIAAALERNGLRASGGSESKRTTNAKTPATR